MISSNVEKPSISVLVTNCEDSVLREILAGIEEESIPYEVINASLTEANILRTLYGAAQLSKIGIAIGVINNRIILQHNKLKEEKPLIDITLGLCYKETARGVGANAARLYKVMPFKNTEIVDVELGEKVRLTVISILQQLNIRVI